ncbi:MAG TPA: Mov34/MPN/PAD-1 family protein [Terriglobales bacterium]|nr:Mov34/MPN/PAD-1 family protein [Terriglobales bacterium]
MSQAAKKNTGVPQVHIAAGVVRSIRQHARSSMKTEVCGVLIGNDEAGKVIASACIQGVNAAQGGAHVTFTQETWEHIYQIKDRDYPDERIVGWYHSHPSFGIFLSDHDLFIHQNFFSSPLQVAWVYDPASDEEGCFGWVNGKIERLTRITVRDGEEDRGLHAGIERGESGEEEEDWSVSIKRDEGKGSSKAADWITYAITHLLAAVIGAGLVIYLLTANMRRAFDEGYAVGVGDAARGTLRVPPSMSVKEFIERSGLDPNRLQPASPTLTIPGNTPATQQPPANTSTGTKK